MSRAQGPTLSSGTYVQRAKRVEDFGSVIFPVEKRLLKVLSRNMAEKLKKVEKGGRELSLENEHDHR